MPRKLVISLLFATLSLSQMMFFPVPQTAAKNSDLLELTAMLPDSDVVATIDAERILSVAAPSLLGEDQKKIEHLKKLMQTIENQIGFNPYEIRQIVFGMKLSAASNVAPADIILKSDFTMIVRTANPNGDLLDAWSKRIDVITAFKEEQSPSRKYMDDFKQYRDFKLEKAAPEPVAATTRKLTESLERTQAIAKTLDALPKLTTDAKAVTNLRAQNKSLAAIIGKYLSVLKADTDTKNLRETSIKLLNRWNAVTVDDAQRTVKLKGILAEAQNIHPVYKKKFENAQKLETLLSLTDSTADIEQAAFVEILDKRLKSELDKTLAAFANLPATKIKKTAVLNSIAGDLNDLSVSLTSDFASINPPSEDQPAGEEIAEQIISDKTKSKSFYETLKQAESEEKINGKRVIIIDTAKLDDAPPVEKPTESTEKKEESPKIAVAFLDERTMAIGFERTIKPFLQREAGYRNQKATEMLNTSANSLAAFAVNSTVVKTLTAETAKTGEKTVGADVLGSSFLSSFAKDINIYGSVNYEAGGSVTNDITMSLGFFKEKIGQTVAPEVASANTENNPNVDNTFEIAGYQVGKDIFYDLFNSFKAVQASMTFKFEKKKVAALIRSTPRIIDRIKTASSTVKKEPTRIARTKSDKLASLPDLITAPQLYIDLAGLFSGKS